MPDDETMTAATVRGIVAGYVGEHKLLSLLGVLSTFVTPLQDVLLPHLTGRVINAIREGQDTEGGTRTGAGPSVMPAFLAVGVAVLVLQAAYVVQDVIDAKLFPSMQTYVRRHMLKCVLDAHDTSQQGELETGDLLSKFVKVPWTVANWFETAKSLVPNLLVYVAATAYFFWLDAALGAGLLVAVVITFASLVQNLRSCGDVSERRDRAMNGVQEGLDEVLHNLPAIYASNQKDAERAALHPREDLFEELYFKTSMCSTWVKAWMVPATVALVAFVLWRGQALVSSGAFSIGQFVSVFVVVLYMMMSMMRIIQHSRAMVYYWGIIKASTDTLSGCGAADKPPTGDDVAGGARGRRTPPKADPDSIVSFEDVTYAHEGSLAPAVAHVSLDVREGDRLAVVGRMGSGKTTLMRMMLRLIEPASGRMKLRGTPYADLTVAEVRRTFGYVPQGAALFDRTVLENVAYGAIGVPPTEADAWAAARRLGLDGVLGALPLGMRTPAGKGGSRLSGGQRQAVWLVRMLLLDADVLVLDEPTSAMDPASREAVARALSRFRTVVIVTHDLDFVAGVATRVARMDAGRMVAVGEDGSGLPAAAVDVPGDGDGDARHAGDGEQCDGYEETVIQDEYAPFYSKRN
jgi:ABC-type multidrug transport system fused ATPase/permease subunit